MRKQLAESGHQRIDNLWTLADLTQQIYLGMPSRSEELRRKWDAARITQRAIEVEVKSVRKTRSPLKSKARGTPQVDGRS